MALLRPLLAILVISISTGAVVDHSQPFTSLNQAAANSAAGRYYGDYNRPYNNLQMYDVYGRFYLDEYGRKVYSTVTEKNIYRDPYDYGYGYGYNYGQPNYNRPYYKELDGGAVIFESEPTYRHLGRGTFRMNGRDAELTCDFPRGLDIVSNFIWERMDRTGKDASDVFYQYKDRMTVRQYPWGSTLYIRDVRPYDYGLYRCIASQRSYIAGRSTPRTIHVYQEVELYPYRK